MKMYFFKYTGGKLLDYFKISKEDTVIIDESDLRQATKDIFLKFGLSESNADLCTDVLLHVHSKTIPFIAIFKDQTKSSRAY